MRLFGGFREEVGGWVRKGWGVWVEEKPDWFTDVWRGSVPVDMIPNTKGGEGDGEKEGVKKKEDRNFRRKKSVMSKVAPEGGEG